MSEIKTYEIPPAIAAKAHINAEQYASMYQRSVDDPNGFWAEQAEKFVTWSKKFDTVMDYSFSPENLYIKWFEGGQLNVSYNCLDRHLATRGDQVAIIWEADNPAEDKKLTYREMHTEVCKLANVLKSKGVKKGDRVCIYLPMIPEAAVAMLACTRVGAVHSIVFGGFSPDSLRDRILDSDCRVLITADESVRGGRNVPLKKNADTALNECPNVGTVLVVQRTGGKVAWTEGRDIWYHEAMATADAVCEPEAMDAEDPLFILYTSGSTGKPKGALHTTGGYLSIAAMTFKYTFDYQRRRDLLVHRRCGLGHGPHLHRLRPPGQRRHLPDVRGRPHLPGCRRFWQVVDKHQVNIFYTAPTAIRALMRGRGAGEPATSRQLLRLLGTVGEPINPEAWEWYHRVVGDARCPIVDTWWQTETGGHLITPLPGATPLKPGSATRPLLRRGAGPG
jgi:acetyl-CoA synthetase